VPAPSETGSRKPPARLSLAHLPTPLERAARFSAERTPGAEIWIKRDDCTGLAFGGNKARKLEYLMASAVAGGFDTVVTFGGVQSNHTRSTAAAARRLGLECHLILAGSPPPEANGNLLLDLILGATLTFLSLTPDQLTPARVEQSYEEAEARLLSLGRRPYRIAPGGTSPLSVLGYRGAFDEMMAQAAVAGLKVSRLVTAFGTGGTLSGLILGNILAGRPVRITAISVAPRGMPEAMGVLPVAELVTGAAELLGTTAAVSGDDITIHYDYSGPAYAVPTTGGIEAIQALARCEGIFLEPVYTGKAMAGLIDLRRRGEIGDGETVIFFHTGGTPALFAHHKALSV